MDHAQDTDDVGVEQRLRLVDACLLHSADEIDASIVDEHVDPVYSATQLFNAGLDRNLISDIERYEFDARERSCRCGCTDAAEDAVTPGSQQLGGYPADAGRCASDQDNTPRSVRHGNSWPAAAGRRSLRHSLKADRRKMFKVIFWPYDRHL